MAQQRDDKPYNELESEMERLQLAISMLTKSNKELKDALQEAPDPEFKTAIEENLVIIAKYKARVWALQEELRRVRGLAGGGVSEPVDSIRQSGAPAPAAAAAAEAGGGGARAGGPCAAAAAGGEGAAAVGGGGSGAGGQAGQPAAGGAPEGAGEGVWL